MAIMTVHSEPQINYKDVPVHTGETLWDIYKENGSKENWNKFMYEVKRMNGTDQVYYLQPGTDLKIPITE